ncbi:MAG: hypothetical protein OEY75_01015 [Hylemonella sp.]|nr:hypothetical protein [Hylemonella sp.]MDH5707666.1 hypothetical protein [Hylemonella sp.]
MTRKRSLPKRQTRSMKAISETINGLSDQILSRPDGYYWRAPDGKQEIGPFETMEDALSDMYEADEQAPEPGETLQEAESELGIADWIDPDTGEPAEGLSAPRLDND